MIPVTALSEYLYCPRKIYLRYVLKFKPVTKDFIIKGKLKHDVFDAANKAEQDLILNIKPSDLDNLSSIYKQAYTGLLNKSIDKFEHDIISASMDKRQLFEESLKKFLDVAAYRSKFLVNLIKQTGLYGQDLINALPVKVKSEIFLSSKRLGLRGVIDRVEMMDGFHVPVELKTGSMPRDGVWPGHRAQLASYILLLNERFNSNQGFIEYIDHNVRKKIVMNPFLEEEIKNLVNQVIDLCNSDTVPDVCSNPNKCKSCNLQNSCFSNG